LKSLRKNLKNVNEAVELVYQSGVLKTCREEANALIEPKWEQFRKQIKPSESKILIRALYESLIDMNYDK
jgi:hypothetical protein